MVGLVLTIIVERIYIDPTGNNNDGFRILVDRLWPRGLRKGYVRVDMWLKEIAPSNSLRKWFGHDEKKWDEFKSRYFKELEIKNEFVNVILNRLQEKKSIILLYGAKDEKYNNALALKEYLEKKIKK
jgi:uncharacterized protein YeaO (DUF488 family)